jgi:dCTP deaminase
LTASSPRQAPPAVQSALDHLLGLHFPTANGRAVCIVRPQWTYNLSYVNLSAMLRNLIAPAALDPNMTLPATTAVEIPGALWTWRRDKLSADEQKTVAPNVADHVAILSFAGLDTHDALLYPILAHELGHFIDYSFTPPLNLDTSINQKGAIAFAKVVAVLTAKATGVPAGVANQIWNDVVGRVNTCVRELLADLLAIRMMGFGFFAAQTELLKTISPWPDPEPLVTGSGYPSTKFRVWSMLRHLLSADFPGNIRAFFAANVTPATLDLTPLTHYLSEWETLAMFGTDLNGKPIPVDPNSQPDVTTALDALTANAVLNAYDVIVDVAKTAIPDANAAHLTTQFFERVERLKVDLPPTVQTERKDSFAEIMAAGWAYELTYGEEREHHKTDLQAQFKEYQKTCQLLMKGVELIPDSDTSSVQLSATNEKEVGTVLSRAHMGNRLQLPVADERHLGLIPITAKTIEAASADLRLGNWFVALRRTRLPGVRLGQDGSDERLARIGREETFVATGKPYLIHPGDLILGATLEFVALPPDLMAFVEGKSKWGRLGLIVATASQVAPGFHGVIVLELANAGTVPLELIPGTPIAQMVFQRMSQRLPDEDLYRGKFYCQIKP